MQFVSMRYMKVYWSVQTYIHIISGWYICIMTYIVVFLSIRKNAWIVDGNEAHQVLGLILLGVVLFIVLAGLYTRTRLKNQKWRTHQLLIFKRIHGVTMNISFHTLIGSWLSHSPPLPSHHPSGHPPQSPAARQLLVPR